jgi:hypothetical protein
LGIIPAVELDLPGLLGKKFSELNVNKNILAPTEKYLPLGICGYAKKEDKRKGDPRRRAHATRKRVGNANKLG